LLSVTSTPRDYIPHNHFFRAISIVISMGYSRVDDVIDIYGESVMSAEVEGSILTVKIDNSPLFVKGSFALVE